MASHGITLFSSVAEVEDALRRIGQNIRERQTLYNEFNDWAEEEKANLEKSAKKLEGENETLLLGIYAYAEDHRLELTSGGKTKTISFAAGEVSWRMTPLGIKLSRKIADIISELKAKKLFQLLRIKEEIDKEMILKNPEVVSGIKGISTQQHEVFSVKPAGTEDVMTEKIKTLRSKLRREKK